MELQKRLPLIIALASGILAVLLLNMYLQRRESEIFQKMKEFKLQAESTIRETPRKTSVVLVAQNEIPVKTMITPNDILIKDMPVEYIQPGAVSSLEQVIGKVTTVPISAGEQIIAVKLLPPDKIVKSLAEVMPSGKRAITVSVDNISRLAGLLKPGDIVDVFALIALPVGSGGAQAGTKIKESQLVSLFQGIEVLAVGDLFIDSEISSQVKTGPARDKAASKLEGTVTLALEPQEAILLSFVQEQGKIKLVLRSSEDTGIELLKQADWDTLFEHLYPASVKESGVSLRKRPVVEIYRGSKKEIVPLAERGRRIEFTE
ncbi:MAG: Flp pilus assembly protein CpaB [Candidatus Omnitrophota bacterium]